MGGELWGEILNNDVLGRPRIDRQSGSSARESESRETSTPAHLQMGLGYLSVYLSLSISLCPGRGVRNGLPITRPCGPISLRESVWVPAISIPLSHLLGNGSSLSSGDMPSSLPFPTSPPPLEFHRSLKPTSDHAFGARDRPLLDLGTMNRLFSRVWRLDSPSSFLLRPSGVIAEGCPPSEVGPASRALLAVCLKALLVSVCMWVWVGPGDSESESNSVGSAMSDAPAGPIMASQWTFVARSARVRGCQKCVRARLLNTFRAPLGQLWQLSSCLGGLGPDSFVLLLGWLLLAPCIAIWCDLGQSFTDLNTIGRPRCDTCQSWPTASRVLGSQGLVSTFLATSAFGSFAKATPQTHGATFTQQRSGNESFSIIVGGAPRSEPPKPGHRHHPPLLGRRAARGAAAGDPFHKSPWSCTSGHTNTQPWIRLGGQLRRLAQGKS